MQQDVEINRLSIKILHRSRTAGRLTGSTRNFESRIRFPPWRPAFRLRQGCTRSSVCEISVNAQSAAEGNEMLVANIGSLRDAIGETNSAAASVLAASGELTATAETLSREVEKFFRDLRSGPADRRQVA
jgi:methyl-accepting chemotaxis protein